VDYAAWSKGAADVAEEALQALGGQNVGPSESDIQNLDLFIMSNPLAKPKIPHGYANIESWDIYISGTRQLSLVHGRLRPGQLLCAQAGSGAVAAKSSLVPTLQAQYGQEVASKIAPRSFRLPEEAQQWQEWISQHPDQVRLCNADSFLLWASTLLTAVVWRV
jgi:hypothetical protein